tara:strand:- start:13100 stop:14092 length:993 start_codon:yes stop_codon:yes gene_type:complete
MRNNIFLAGIAILSLPLSMSAHAQDKGNNGQGGQKIKAVQGNGSGDKAVGRSNTANKASKNLSGPTSQNDRAGGNSQANNREKIALPDGRKNPADRKIDRPGQKTVEKNNARGKIKAFDHARMRSVENGRYVWREPSFQGCPPGLAKKGNGCLPPGQARKLSAFNDPQSRWLRYASWFSGDRSGDWRYDQRYAYRIDPATGLARTIVPLLGGALSSGSAWPQSYSDYQVNPYYQRYYGSGANDNVRYADGAIFRVNPENQMIDSIAGLLTGDDWNVGSPAPQGYDLYNIPYNYRDRYAESSSSLYRYNDGYVYEIDPTTQIVRKIIEMVL